MNKILVIILIGICANCFAQDYDNIVILDQQSVDGNVFMIDLDGNVLKEFDNSYKVRTEDEFNSAFKTLSFYSTFISYDFSNGPLPVKYEDEWILFDKEGEEHLNLGSKYKSMTAPFENIYKIQPIDIERNKPSILYVNSDGEELFDNTKFWKASFFKNNIAFAQLENKSGDWVKLNSETNEIEPIENGGKFYEIERKTELYSVATLKLTYSKTIIDNNGNILFNPDELIGKKNCFINSIKENMIVFSNDHKYYFTDEQYKIVHEIYPLLGIKGISDEMIFTRNDRPFGNIIYNDFTEVKPSLDENEVFICDLLSEDYLGGFVIDTVERKTTFTLFDNSNLEVVANSDKIIGEVIGNRLIEIDPKEKFKKKLVSISDFKGNVIYDVNPSNKVYKGIEDATSIDPLLVEMIELSNDEDLSKLIQFKNLRHISLYGFSFKKMPLALSGFEKLEKLEIYRCSELEKLPNWIIQCQNLKTLRIINCDKLAKIESKIKFLQNLELLSTENYKFEEGFIDEMKEKQPKLKIDSWFSMDD